MTTNVEISCPTSDEASFENEAKRKSIQISERPSDLLSKEGFALYIGKTPRAVAEMASGGGDVYLAGRCRVDFYRADLSCGIGVLPADTYGLLSAF